MIFYQNMEIRTFYLKLSLIWSDFNHEENISTYDESTCSFQGTVLESLFRSLQEISLILLLRVFSSELVNDA